MRRGSWTTAWVMMLALSSGVARADGSFAQLNNDGAQAYQDGRYEDAANLLQQAYAIRPDPILLFNIARAYERAGNDDQAVRFYQRYLDTKNSDVETLKKAARSLDLARSRITQKQIDDAKAKADQERLAQQKADQQKAEQDRLAREQADAAARDQAQRDAAAKAAAQAKLETHAAEQRPSLTPGLALMGVGAAAAVVGLAFGVGEQGDANQFNQTFDRVQRPALRQKALNSAHAADGCYAGAVVVGGIGIALLVRAFTWSPPADGAATSSTAAAVVPDGAGLAWRSPW